MEAVLVDTDVFSYLLKDKHPLAPAYGKIVKGKTIALSFVTVGELLSGAYKRGWGLKKLADLQNSFKNVIVVPFDYRICEEYGKLSLLKTPANSDRTIAANDRWIAACAIRHKLPLVSNNRQHFEGIPGLILISEAPKPALPKAQGLPLPPRPDQV